MNHNQCLHICRNINGQVHVNQENILRKDQAVAALSPSVKFHALQI